MLWRRMSGCIKYWAPKADACFCEQRSGRVSISNKRRRADEIVIARAMGGMVGNASVISNVEDVVWASDGAFVSR
jgi:hypothetical protein